MIGSSVERARNCTARSNFETCMSHSPDSQSGQEALSRYSLGSSASSSAEESTGQRARETGAEPNADSIGRAGRRRWTRRAGRREQQRRLLLRIRTKAESFPSTTALLCPHTITWTRGQRMEKLGRLGVMTGTRTRCRQSRGEPPSLLDLVEDTVMRVPDEALGQMASNGAAESKRWPKRFRTHEKVGARGLGTYLADLGATRLKPTTPSSDVGTLGARLLAVRTARAKGEWSGEHRRIHAPVLVRWFQLIRVEHGATQLCCCRRLAAIPADRTMATTKSFDCLVERAGAHWCALRAGEFDETDADFLGIIQMLELSFRRACLQILGLQEGRGRASHRASGLHCVRYVSACSNGGPPCGRTPARLHLRCSASTRRIQLHMFSLVVWFSFFVSSRLTPLATLGSRGV